MPALAALLAALAGTLAAPAAATAAPAAAATAAASHSAGARLTAMAGYAWSGDTSGYYTYDSTGQKATVEGDGTGSYLVIFPGLQHLTGEHVDLTTYGPGAVCQPFGFENLASGLTISVNCATSTGTPADSAFDIVVTKPTRAPGGVFDYDLVPAAKSGKLTGQDQYNSARKTNSVRHLSTGRYQITLPGPASSGVSGTVQVTDLNGGGLGGCELAGWHGTRAGQVVDVGCYTPGGARQNRSFGVTYARGGNLMGQNGVTGATAYANRPTALAYQPRTQSSSVREASIFVTRQGRGQYLVIPAGSAGPSAVNGGNVEVSAVGTGGRRCYVDAWGQATTPEIFIDCVNRQGARADTAFTIQWSVA